MVQWQASVLDFFEHGLEDNDIHESTLSFKEVHSIEKGIGVRDQVVALGKLLGSTWSRAEDERRRLVVKSGSLLVETYCAELTRAWI